MKKNLNISVQLSLTVIQALYILSEYKVHKTPL